MRIYEAIVRGLESIGVDAAFGGAGENAAGMMMALQAFEEDPSGHHPARAGGLLHCLRLRDVHQQARRLLGDRRARRLQPVLRASPWPCPIPIPLLAISGYASLEWSGKGSLNETSGVNRTPIRGDVRGHHQGKLAPDRRRRHVDVLEEAVNLAFEGRPGPVHIHVPENLTHHGVEVDELSRPPARRGAGAARSGARRRGRRAASPLPCQGQEVVALVGFGAIRSGAGAGVRRLIERFQIPLLTTLDGKGIVAESHPLCGRRVLRQRPCQRVEGVPRGRRRARDRQFVQPARDLRLSRRPVRRRTLIHINISEMEIDKAYKADYALVADAKPALDALYRRAGAKVGPRPPARVDGRDYEARLHPAPSRRHPSRPARPGIGAPAAAARHRCSPTPAPISPGSAITSSSRTARTSASPAASGRWRGTSTARSA